MSTKVFSEKELLQAVRGRAKMQKLTMEQAVKATTVCPLCKSAVVSSTLIQALYGCRCPNCGVYFVDLGELEMRMPNLRENRVIVRTEKPKRSPRPDGV